MPNRGEPQSVMLLTGVLEECALRTHACLWACIIIIFFHFILYQHNQCLLEL